MPIITGKQPNRVQEFHEKLKVSTQALDTMNKLKDINGYVKITLDKLPGVLADLVRLDHDWQDWGYTELVEALRKWTERNSKIFVSPDKNLKLDNMYHARENKSSECKAVVKVSDRMLILSQK